MWEKNVIGHTTSKWAAPFVLVSKADGSLRFCIEYRKLNCVTKKDNYPLLRMEDFVDSLAAAKWFSTFDFNFGFWPLKLRTERE